MRSTFKIYIDDMPGTGKDIGSWRCLIPSVRICISDGQKFEALHSQYGWLARTGVVRA